jgi:hypothetical protein
MISAPLHRAMAATRQADLERAAGCCTPARKHARSLGSQQRRLWPMIRRRRTVAVPCCS